MTSLVAVLLKMTLCLCIYFAFTKKTIILSPFKTDTLNKSHHVYFNDFDMPFINIRQIISNFIVFIKVENK